MNRRNCDRNSRLAFILLAAAALIGWTILLNLFGDPDRTYGVRAAVLHTGARSPR